MKEYDLRGRRNLGQSGSGEKPRVKENWSEAGRNSRARREEPSAEE